MRKPWKTRGQAGKRWKNQIRLIRWSQRRSGSNYNAANNFIRSGKFGDTVMLEMTWNVNQPGR